MRVTRGTPFPMTWVAVAFAFVTLAAAARFVAADPIVLDARVVWAQGGRAYLVARDSGAVAPGMRVTLLDRRKTLASGVVTSVTDGRLASLVIESGSLGRVKRLDRLRVVAERVEPAAFASLRVVVPRLLRVGVPDGARQNLAIACGDLTIVLPPRVYRVEPLAGGVQRGVRHASEALAWPETLIVRRFGDAADQEIAFERGELDVAVFWPGEPSARARSGLRGGEWLRGLRARGALAVDPEPYRHFGRMARPAAGAGAARDPRLARLNAELFGGDLVPWASVDTSRAAAPWDSTTWTRGYSVDESLPGRQAIEHFLNGGATLFVRDKLGPVPLRYADLSVAGPETAADTESGATPVFALRCPIACRTELAWWVRDLGPDELANLMVCAPEPTPR